MQYPVASNLRALTDDSVQKCSTTHFSESLLHSYFLYMHQVPFSHSVQVSFCERVQLPPSAPPHRALRIHFVGFALLCTHTHAPQVHSYISDFYERLKKKKKKDSPSVCRKVPSKVQSPEFQEDLKVCRCHWSACIEVAHRGEAAICGCLLGRGGNKMEVDGKQREVNFLCKI